MLRSQVKPAVFERINGATPTDPEKLASSMLRVPTNHDFMQRPRLGTMTKCVAASLPTDDESKATAIAAGVILRPGEARDRYLRACGDHDTEFSSQLLDKLAGAFRSDHWQALTSEVARAIDGIA